MQVSSINNNNPNFGHSFRVSICLKNENGCGDIFVNPHSDRQLYKKLNSQITGWLNEDYYANIRNFFGVKKKINKTKPSTDTHIKMIEDLRKIDSDYANFQHARSVYNNGKLAYIVTGTDVPIIENIEGAKQIGIAKYTPFCINPSAHDQYVKAISKAVKENMLAFVQNDNIILRSNNNKEIMLRVVFKETGKNSKGSPIYELDKYEFHENRSNPTLKPVDSAFINFKHGTRMLEELKATVQHHIYKITGKRTCLNNNDLKHIIQRNS